MEGISDSQNISKKLSTNSKDSLLRGSIHKVSNPAFLCKSDNENPYHLEIIECNEEFLKCFDLQIGEVINHNYDFLFSDHSAEYGSSDHFEYTNLLKAVKNLKLTSVRLSITHPKISSRHDQFRVNFSPSHYKDKNNYCILTFEKLVQIEEISPDKQDSNSVLLIQNTQRALRNERLLRNISDLIASDLVLEEVAKRIAKILCTYLKVDRCFLRNSDSNSGFIVEYCSDGVSKISQEELCVKRYVDLQDLIFNNVNQLKKNNTVLVYEDLHKDPTFEEVEDILSDFRIDSQIVSITTSDNAINGGIYIQQSIKRKWLFEEIELIEIVANHFSMAIDKANYIGKLIISNQDLTNKTLELKKSLKKEKKIRQMQSEFVATVSHEFKTPLQIIDGGREFIVRKLNSLSIVDESIDKGLSRIKNAVNRMTNLINSTLDLSKIEINQGEIIVCKNDFSLKDLIADIIDRNYNLISEKYVIIDADIEKLPELYHADQKLLDHCLSNMISNAIKYSKEGGSINISGNIKGDSLFIKVIDSGIGIPKQDLKRVGKKFFRAGNTLSMPGTGIGLYLTKYFVELHGGDIVIESEVDIGTSITVSLPRYC